MLQICSKNGAELVMPAKSLGAVPKSLGSVPIYLDPMIGFGTTREEDLEILKTIPELATKDHMEALSRLGPCPEHRRSFGPVANVI